MNGEREMNFAKNYIKIKSSWFNEESKIKKIGIEGFYLYLILYKYYIPNQQMDTFSTSVYQLKKESGFTEDKTLDLLKCLIRQKVIVCSVTRWDRYNTKENMIIESIDLPQLNREVRHGKEVDIPATENDYYIIIDSKIMQLYMDLKLNIASYSIYAVISKYNNNAERKSDISINEIADRFGVSNDKIHKTIHQMNRNRVLYSSYKRIAGKNKGEIRYKFEHYLFDRCSSLETMQTTFEKKINQNIAKWDKKTLQ